MAALFPVRNNQERPKIYSSCEKMRFNKDRMPLPLSQITRFEKTNRVNINVYAFEEFCTIYPAYLSKIKGGGKPVNLLLLNDDKRSHFCLIKNLDRLLKLFCGLTEELVLKMISENFVSSVFRGLREQKKQHRQLRLSQQPLRIEMPLEGAVTKFTIWYKTTMSFRYLCLSRGIQVRTDGCEDLTTHVIEQQFLRSFGAVLVDVQDGKVEKEQRRRLYQVFGHNEPLVKNSGRTAPTTKNTNN